MDIPRESQYEECKLPEGSNFMAFHMGEKISRFSGSYL